MTKTLIGLCIAQSIAAVAMLIGIAIDVETILATGPILAILGLMFAFACRPTRSWAVLALALSGPLLTAFIALIIVVFRLGPGDAAVPITTILGAYLAFTVPLSFMSARWIYGWHAADRRETNGALQFSIKFLLIATAFVCLVIGGTKSILDLINEKDSVLFSCYALVVLALCGAVIWRFVAYDGARTPAG